MEIQKILHTYYDLKFDSCDHLEGFEDKTYKLQIEGASYIFKQYVFSDEKVSFLKAENAVLHTLESVGKFCFPRPVLTKQQKTLVVEKGHIYRLLTFLDGDLLGSVEHTDLLIYSLGELLGTLDKHLMKLYYPAFTGRELEWDLRYTKKNIDLLEYIENPADRNLVRYFFLQFDEHVYPVQDQLRKSLIHNDANDWNIVVNKQKTCGIFDFGDMAYTWLVNEIAIALTYVMMGKEDPFSVADELLKGYHRVVPLLEQELDILYYLVASRLCISVCNSARGKSVKPDSDYMTISEDAAWELLHRWIAINPSYARQRFRQAVGYTGKSTEDRTGMIKERHMHLSKVLSLSYDRPIVMEGAAFQYMYDADGNTFLDAYNNIMLVGHCHPNVVEAGQRALAQLNTNTRYLYPVLSKYSEKLLTKFPGKLNKVFFVNSGSEATDLAIRMSRVHTKRKHIMVLENGYHGHTSTGIEISHYKYTATGGQGKSEYILETPMPKAFGSGIPDDGSSGKYFAELAGKRLEPYTGEIAAFIAEPIMGCGGQVPLARSYLKEVYALVREQGGVCISDEVQVGFGRLGEYFWGYELHEVIPDIVVLGKPMGNGHPIGAVVTTEEIASSFEKGPEFFSSFGGNPVSCAIGLAVLDVIEEENLQSRAKEVGQHLTELLRKLQKRIDVIADVRGYGMFLGVELADRAGQPLTQLADRVINRFREKYILLSIDGPARNVIKIKPPLSFSKQNAETLVDEFEVIMESLL